MGPAVVPALRRSACNPVPDHSTISRFRTATLGGPGPGRAAVRRSGPATGRRLANGWSRRHAHGRTLVIGPHGGWAGRGQPTAGAWTRKGGGAHFGYKAHLGWMRRGSNVLTPTHVNESARSAGHAFGLRSTSPRRLPVAGAGDQRPDHAGRGKHQRGLPYWQQPQRADRAGAGGARLPLKRSYGYRTVRYAARGSNRLQPAAPAPGARWLPTWEPPRERPATLGARPAAPAAGRRRDRTPSAVCPSPLREKVGMRVAAGVSTHAQPAATNAPNQSPAVRIPSGRRGRFVTGRFRATTARGTKACGPGCAQPGTSPIRSW